MSQCSINVEDSADANDDAKQVSAKPHTKITVSCELVQISHWICEFVFEDGLSFSIQVELRAIPSPHPSPQVYSIVLSCQRFKSKFNDLKALEIGLPFNLARAVKMDDEDRLTWCKMEEKSATVYQIVVKQLMSVYGIKDGDA